MVYTCMYETIYHVFVSCMQCTCTYAPTHVICICMYILQRWLNHHPYIHILCKNVLDTSMCAHFCMWICVYMRMPTMKIHVKKKYFPLVDCARKSPCALEKGMLMFRWLSRPLRYSYPASKDKICKTILIDSDRNLGKKQVIEKRGKHWRIWVWIKTYQNYVTNSSQYHEMAMWRIGARSVTWAWS